MKCNHCDSELAIIGTKEDKFNTLVCVNVKCLKFHSIVKQIQNYKTTEKIRYFKLRGTSQGIAGG